MSKEMKLIMENWRGSILQEQHAIELHEQLVNEFVLDLKQIQESSNDLNEVLSKVSEFAKKAYNTYKDIKNNTIQANKATNSDETINKIIEVLDTKIRPAVARDGGDIKFKSFENGIVKVELQGSCSGCPSSLMTLKQGVQNLLKHYVKEVNSVEAV